MDGDHNEVRALSAERDSTVAHFDEAGLDGSHALERTSFEWEEALAVANGSLSKETEGLP